MSILGSIIHTIFEHPAAKQQPSGQGAKPSVPPSPAAPSSASPQRTADIEAVMNALVAERGEKLNWKDSVVDLLKALGLDSSLDARIRLAQELRAPVEVMRAGGPELNMWLHDKVMETIRANGGKMPEGLR